MTKQWLREHVDPLLAELPSGRCHFVGGDFGRSGDLSVFWPVTEHADLTLATPFTVELRNCPYRTQQQILFHMIDSLPRFSGLALDARGNGSALAEFARQEYGPEQVEEVMISESWYRETMPKLKSRIEDKTVILPKSADVLSDLRSLRVVKGVARVPDARGDGHPRPRKTGQRRAVELRDRGRARWPAVLLRWVLKERTGYETTGVGKSQGATLLFALLDGRG